MMKKIAAVSILVALIAIVISFARNRDEFIGFKPAADFPRGAVIYLQFRDLPALIGLWRGSKFREKYLASQNFGEFGKRHLALKLAARASEIAGELGVAPDLGLLESLSETSAAIAVYDIGKTEFVLIAPMSEEKLLASRLFVIKESFESLELNGLVVYRKEFRVDNGRELQHVIFAAFRGRMIVSTNERRFRQTVENIRVRDSANTLAGQPGFARLAQIREPGLATVWLDQSALNKDWYFRKYWLMSDVSKLENTRAARFDFDAEDDRVTEKRIFLNTNSAGKLPPSAFRNLARYSPTDAEYADIRSVTANVDPLAKLLPVRAEPDAISRERLSFTFDNWEKSDGYGYLSDEYEESVVENEDEERPFAMLAGKNKNDVFQRLAAAARTVGVMTVRSPEKLPAPYFMDDRKAVALAFADPNRLSIPVIEAALSERIQSALTVGQHADAFDWLDFESSDGTARILELPSLKRQIAFNFDGKVLIVSNSPDLLRQMIRSKSDPRSRNLDRLSVIDLKRSREIFGAVFAEIENESKNRDGFTISIASLLDSFAEAEKIEISERTDGELLYQEIELKKES